MRRGEQSTVHKVEQARELTGEHRVAAEWTALVGEEDFRGADLPEQ